MNTRDLIKIKHIEKNYFIRDDDTFCVLVKVDGLQFFLLDPSSQEIVISQFQNFLNSLDFNLQILILSRYAKLDNYLKYLQSFANSQPNELLKLQFQDYLDFITSLNESTSIMQKIFLLVITLHPKDVGVLKFGKEKEHEVLNQLWQRVDFVLRSLSPLGINPRVVEDFELWNLLYNVYNPNIFYVDKTEKIKNLIKLLEPKNIPPTQP